MPATPGYSEASKRAEAYAKIEEQKRQAEEAKKREIVERTYTKGYARGHTAPGGKQTYTGRELAEIKGASAEVEQKAKAKQQAKEFAAQEFAKAKAEAGPGRSVSQILSIGLETGEVSGRTVTRSIRSQAPEVQRPVYENPQLEQMFGTYRVGDIIRKQSAKAERGEPSLYGSRTLYNKEAIDDFVRAYDANLRYRRGEGEADFGIAGPVGRIGYRPPGIEERTPFGGFGQITITRQTEKQEFLKEMEPQPLGLAKEPAQAATDVFSNFFTQFIEPGTKGIGIGIGALFGGKTGKQAERIGAEAQKQYKPTVEDEFFGRVIGPTVGDIFGGARSSENRANINRRFGEFGQLLGKENPASVAASIGASAVLFAPELFFKVPKAVRAIPDIFSAVSKGRKAEFGTRIPKGMFDLIQMERSEKSIYRYFVNYEQKGALKDLARGFDYEEAFAKVRTGAIKTDEVIITKEFERAPIGRFVQERRPAIFGERTTKTIDEELEIFKLNPSKPRKTPTTLSDIVKFEVPKERPTAGAPFKLPEERNLPQLGDIMKPDLWTAKTTEKTPFTFGRVQPVKKLSDIIRSDLFITKPAETVPFTFPTLKRVPKTLGEMMKTDLWKPAKREGAPFKVEGDIYALPKLSDIVRPFRRAKRGKKTLSESEIADLFDVLEGRKEIEPARNLMTRREQGQFSGDFDIDRAISNEVKRLTGRKGKTETRQAGQGLIQIVKPQTTRKEAKSIEKQLEKTIFSTLGSPSKGRKKPRYGDIFATEFGRVSYPPGFGPKSFGARTEKSTVSDLEKIAFKGLQISIPKLGTERTARTSINTLLGISTRPSTRTFERQTSQTLTAFRTTTKQTFGRGFGTRSFPIEPTITRSVTDLDRIIKETTRQRLKVPLPGFGSTKRKRRGKKGKTSAELRAFRAGDIVGAFLGSESPITKKLYKEFGRSY